MKLLLTAINAKYIHSNLAVYSLRAYAKRYRNQITLAEYTINHRVEDILAGIYKQHPDVLFFSCYIWNIRYVRELIVEFHKICPDIPIWLGGPEVSYEVETFLRENPAVTGIMMGEGEKIFEHLCAYYVDGDGALSEIKGLAYRTENGTIQINEWEEVLDMSTIPFCYEDMDEFKNKIIYYETSRGCPFRCSYCLSSVEKSLRFRSMDLVKKELAFFIEQEVPQVKFVDRTFNCEKKRAMEIWKFLKENDRGITNFHFEIAADLLDEEEIAFLATLRPGLIQLEIGVQTTNPATIQEIHRSMDLKRVKTIVEKVKKPKNIHQHLDLIAGLPYEDYETFTHSFDEIYALKPQQLQLGFLKVLKGSYIYEHQQEYGLKYSSQPPYEVLCTNWLSYAEVLKIKQVEEMLEVYYNSGQFQMLIRLLEQQYDSAFEMFVELGQFYEEQGYFDQKHSRLQRFSIFLEFAKRKDPKEIERYCEAATFDLYARENAKSRPDWAVPLQSFKQVTHQFCKKGKLSHVEPFHYALLQEGETKRLARQEEPYYLLFDYENRSRIDHQATITKCKI
ncbi:MAG: B12-binding domain-containing radical SAM protein [Lachnospiraceae bacterium]